MAWALVMASAVTALIVGTIHERSAASSTEVPASPAATSDLGKSELPSSAQTTPATQTPPSSETPTRSPTPARSPTPFGLPTTTAKPSPIHTKWVEVARFEGISKAYRTKKPFKVGGPVRARYRFYFEADQAYSYGELDVYPAEEDGTCGGPPLGGWRLNEKKGTQKLRDMHGRTCANFWPPTVHWGRGNLTIIIETLR